MSVQYIKDIRGIKGALRAIRALRGGGGGHWGQNLNPSRHDVKVNSHLTAQTSASKTNVVHTCRITVSQK